MSKLVESNKETDNFEVEKSETEKSEISAITTEIEKQTKQVSTDERLSDSKHIGELFDKVLLKEINPEAIRGDQTLQKLLQEIKIRKSSLRDAQTGCFWFLYMDMIDSLKQFIKAKRTGKWELHLKVIKEMLPFFAAAGHNLYLKSGYIHLQQMTELQKTNPEVYHHFTMGNHVVRRTGKVWAGLPTDKVIEQVLMHSFKFLGGMTRGHGMSESQRAQLLLSMPACAKINNAMQEFTDQIVESNEQHKDMFGARIKRNVKDVTLSWTILQNEIHLQVKMKRALEILKQEH